MNIQVYDRESKQVKKVDKGLWMFQETWTASA